MYKKLLVPLDGSELAEKSLPYALQLTEKLGLETTILHVCGVDESSSLLMCKAYIERVAETLTQQLEKDRADSALSSDTRGSLVTGETAVGDVPTSILEYADKRRFDFILMSNRGHSGKSRWLMGSVAHKVLTASHVPVLIIHPENGNRIAQPGWPRKFLLLLDGSRLSELVLPYMEDLCGQDRSDVEITLFQVCEPPDLLSDYPEAIMPLTWDEHVKKVEAASEQSCSNHLSDIKKQLEIKGLKTRIQVVLGNNVVDEIIKYIQANPFDLVSMTTHGRSGISKWPYGHVADRMIQSVSIPLFLIRPVKQ